MSNWARALSHFLNGIGQLAFGDRYVYEEEEPVGPRRRRRPRFDDSAARGFSSAAGEWRDGDGSCCIKRRR